MATMLFDRIVPTGNNAYFPFQMSAASLSPTATVYEANDAAGADTALASGVSVDDMGGGLYALKVLAANMTADKLYYGVVTSGTESVRIPMWAFAPTKHIAEVLADLAVVDGVVDDIKTEIGDVSAQSFTGISAPATVAAGLAEIFNKVNGVQSDLDNATDGLGALKTLIETETTAIDSALTTIDNEIAALQGDVTSILADTNELQGDWANGGRLDLLLDRTVVASEAAEDLIGLAADTSSAATVFGKIAALSADVATVDGNVDSIKAAIENATYGLSALETRLDSVDTDLGNIESKLDTVDTVVDGIATEVGDVSAAFGGGSPPATVAAALKVIYDAQQSAANVWDDAITGSESAGTAGKRLYDLSEDWANGGRLDVILDELTTQGDTNEGKLDDVLADTVDLQSKLGAPTGASLSADIAAIKSVVDTLQVTTNARLAPSMPSELYSAKEAIRVALGLNVYEGTSGALEDPNPLGTNGNAQGQALIKAKTVGGGSDPSLFDAASAGNALGTTDASGLTSWYKMVRAGTGKFVAYAEIPAYFNKTVEVSFYCEDSDPNAVQKFETSRYMLVRSPVQASFGGGAF